MSEARIELWTAGDGYSLKYRRYDPVGSTIGEVVSLHGIQSHGGWYDGSSRWLADHGWGVSFLDRRGSGLNEQQRGDCPSFRRLLDDIAEFMRPLRARTRAPVVVQGISWGGKLALALQKRHPGLCDGVVLIAPGFRPKVRPPLHVRLAVLLQRMVHPTRQVPIPLSDPELFTANAHWRQMIRDDPLAWRQATVRFLWESRRLDFYCRRARRHVAAPVLLLLAGQDRIIDNAKTRRYFRKMRLPDSLPRGGGRLGREGDAGRGDGGYPPHQPSPARGEGAKPSTLKIVEFPDAQHTLEFEDAGPPHLEQMQEWLVTMRRK